MTISKYECRKQMWGAGSSCPKENMLTRGPSPERKE